MSEELLSKDRRIEKNYPGRDSNHCRPDPYPHALTTRLSGPKDKHVYNNCYELRSGAIKQKISFLLDSNLRSRSSTQSTKESPTDSSSLRSLEQFGSSLNTDLTSPLDDQHLNATGNGGPPPSLLSSSPVSANPADLNPFGGIACPKLCRLL